MINQWMVLCTRPGKHTKSIKKAMETIEIEELPMEMGGSFHSYVKLPESNSHHASSSHGTDGWRS